MLNLNAVSLQGHLTRDPELKTLESGKKVVNFSVAHNFVYGKGEDKKEEVTFIDCEAWEATAEFVGTYLKKGSWVQVLGALRQSTWKDSENKTHSKLFIRVSDADTLPKGDKE